MSGPLSCPGNQVFDEHSCTCVCPVGSLTKYDCIGNLGFDAEQCECKCCDAWLTSYVCPPGTWKDTSKCACTPYECNEPSVGHCANVGKVWDVASCDCICQTELQCEENEFFDFVDCTCHNKCEIAHYFKLHKNECESCEGQIRGCEICHRSTKCD